MSLYVQLSRATSWDGIHLMHELEREDFIEPLAVLPDYLQHGIANLERLAEETRLAFERRAAERAAECSTLQAWLLMAEETTSSELRATEPR